MDGNHRIELRKNGWKPLSSDVRVKANETVKLPLFQLEKVDGVLKLATSPPGAAVTVNGELRGPSPITLALRSGQDHKVTVDKAGFKTVSRTVRLDGYNPKSLEIELTAEYGIVFLNTRPAGARLVRPLSGSAVLAGGSAQALAFAAPHPAALPGPTHSATPGRADHALDRSATPAFRFAFQPRQAAAPAPLETPPAHPARAE